MSKCDKYRDYRWPKYDNFEVAVAKFDEDDRKDLISIGKLPVSAINELERTVAGSYYLLKHYRKMHSLLYSQSAKEERKFLDNLQKLVDKLYKQLRSVRQLPLPFQVQFTNTELYVPLRENARSYGVYLRKIRRRKDSAGKKESDLGFLVYKVAIVMLAHSIKPQKRGEQFLHILSCVFRLTGEDDKKVESSIESAWPCVEELIEETACLAPPADL